MEQRQVNQLGDKSLYIEKNEGNIYIGNYVKDAGSAFLDGSFELSDYSPSISPAIFRKEVEQLKQWIDQRSRIVFFGGAGVSTESGIPDFRSVDGLYNQQFEYPPEYIISHSFFKRDPSYFFRFYREKMLPLGFEPNITHRSGRKMLSCQQWSRKISTACTSRQAAGPSMSSTAAFCGTFA